MALLEVQNLSKSFPIKGGIFQRTIGEVKAVTDVSFQLNEGETLGIVGESGCGKTTLGRTLVRLYEPTAGKILFRDQDFTAFPKHELKVARRDFQMIFQDPYASLNPRMSVRTIIEEPLKLHKIGTPVERLERVKLLLSTVGLRQETMNRFPHEFSGGQRQRIGIARALALEPKIIIADEPVSALDVSIQSQVLNLMVELQQRLGLTYVFITHDLAVVKYISDNIAVMYLGKIVEMGKTESIFANPRHPYTRALLSSVPLANPHKRGNSEALGGDVPSPSNPPPGCVFHTRCKMAKDECRQRVPVLKPSLNDKFHQVACLLED